MSRSRPQPTGRAASATVWMEIGAGAAQSAEHADSSEEPLDVVRGEVEATVGDETGTLHTGDLAVVPAMELHLAPNLGDEQAARWLLPAVSCPTFAMPLGPAGPQIFVIGGPM